MPIVTNRNLTITSKRMLFISNSYNPKSSQTRKPIRVLTIDFWSYRKSNHLYRISQMTDRLQFNFSQVSLVTPYYYYITSNIITNHQDSYTNNRNLKSLNRSNKSKKTLHDLSPIINYISFILKYIHQCIYD